jgi:hypothetical protein
MLTDLPGLKTLSSTSAIVVTEGHWSRLGSHLSPEVVEAGKRLQAFHSQVINEREF